MASRAKNQAVTKLENKNKSQTEKERELSQCQENFSAECLAEKLQEFRS